MPSSPGRLHQAAASNPCFSGLHATAVCGILQLASRQSLPSLWSTAASSGLAAALECLRGGQRQPVKQHKQAITLKETSLRRMLQHALSYNMMA